MSSGRAALIVGFRIQGLAIARALSSSGISVYGLEPASAARIELKRPVLYTSSARVLFARSLSGDALLEALLDARKSIPESRVVLYPTSDHAVMTIARNWADLEAHYDLSWAECRDRVEQVIQKTNLPALCSSAGVRCPNTVTIRTEQDLQQCVQRLKFPMLLKPNRQSFAFKTHRCETLDELYAFAGPRLDGGPLIAQEWIEGPDRSLYFYSCFSDRGAEYFGFTGRKVRTSPPEVGIATVIETEVEAGVREAARKLLPVLGLSGPVAMEFKKDALGRYWFIEANVGRTEYCVDLAIQAGFNLPDVEYRHALGEALPPVPELTECMWFDTDKEPFCYAHLCLKERTLRPHGKTPVFPYYRQERWLVRAAAVLEIVKKLYGRAVERLGSGARSIGRRLRET